MGFHVECIHYFKRALYFKKPVVYQLEYVDIVIVEKALFLVSWKFADRYKLSIPLLKKKYRSSRGSIVLKLPAHIDGIKLIVSTWWRKKEYTIHLKKMQLEPAIAEQLVQQFKPMVMLQLENASIGIIKKFHHPIIPVPANTISLPAVQLKKIELSTDKFIYSNQ